MPYKEPDKRNQVDAERVGAMRESVVIQVLGLKDTTAFPGSPADMQAISQALDKVFAPIPAVQALPAGVDEAAQITRDLSFARAYYQGDTSITQSELTKGLARLQSALLVGFTFDGNTPIAEASLKLLRTAIKRHANTTPFFGALANTESMRSSRPFVHEEPEVLAQKYVQTRGYLADAILGEEFMKTLDAAAKDVIAQATVQTIFDVRDALWKAGRVGAARHLDLTAIYYLIKPRRTFVQLAADNGIARSNVIDRIDNGADRLTAGITGNFTPYEDKVADAEWDTLRDALLLYAPHSPFNSGILTYRQEQIAQQQNDNRGQVVFARCAELGLDKHLALKLLRLERQGKILVEDLFSDVQTLSQADLESKYVRRHIGVGRETLKAIRDGYNRQNS